MSWSLILYGFGTAVVGGFTTWLWRDGYQCLPNVRKWMLQRAAMWVPPQQRARTVEEMLADINDMWPSEVARTIAAVTRVWAVFWLGQELNKIARNPKSVRSKTVKKPTEDPLIINAVFKKVYGSLDDRDLHMTVAKFEEVREELEKVQRRWWALTVTAVALGMTAVIPQLDKAISYLLSIFGSH